MTLSCGKPYSAHSYAPGIYINEATITAAEDVSGQTLPFFERSFDIAIKLTLDVGKEWQPELLIAGNFKRDSAGNISGWGSGFLVQEALYRLGYAGPLAEGNSIPKDALDDLIGKPLLRLSYVSGQKENGKLRYSDWNQIATLEEGPEHLVKKFRKSLAKGYPKNYRPDLLEVAVPVNAEDPF